MLLWLDGAWNSPKSMWVLGVIQPITLPSLFFACLHGISLYPSNLVFRKVFKRAPCRSAALSICSFIAAVFCLSDSSCISFQSSCLHLPNSAKSPAPHGPSPVLQERKWIQEGSQDAHSFHMFLSFSPATRYHSEHNCFIHVSQFPSCLWCEGRLLPLERSVWPLT